jgi:CubicO group peptidase (beta-lactamase class C family)
MQNVVNMKFPLSLVLFLLINLHVNSQDADYKSQAQGLFNKSHEEGSYVGASAGFAVDGNIKWTSALGFSNQKTSAAFQTTTLTRIASISKSMTAVAIMQLFEQGKIDLDTPIQKYLPEFPTKKEGAITIRQLLNHSSGIGAYESSKESENQKQYNTFEEAMVIFKNRDLIAIPGTVFNYTTYGYVVLGAIIERVSGLSYETYMKQNIWDKAGMTTTTTIANNQLTEVYHKNSRGKIKQEEPTNLSDRIPGGGVYSNITDLLKFGMAILNHTLLRESTFQMMIEDSGLKNEGNGYGLGWYLYGMNPNHGNVVGHNGAQIGASAWLMLLPAENAVVAVLANTSGALDATFKLTVSLFNIAASSKN